MSLFLFHQQQIALHSDDIASLPPYRASGSSRSKLDARLALSRSPAEGGKVAVDDLRAPRVVEDASASRNVLSDMLASLAASAKTEATIHQTFVPASWLQGKGLEEVLKG
ncbi:hypothetical protein GUITHDRAFT_121729 [Guillardia theta CCMP2712]|uniref:Uncharacterized protein n=1 Tax=Guillardia theta (strain CCMP2712) TaxID=905079 RepID=L1I769_GUITC|nr:hypothetical protein GUITHDRAFT_121729 [Guillardia theta CCMP2712]EKX32103.1 hypothetical protein GUITHDRAFT_121729 [Guillardia theta CCMP2712]|eukprot:XP_005819083.1 hypothetical protein GUITHDRAFT_121729 [Guillardia theta CCMP2712]